MRKKTILALGLMLGLSLVSCSETQTQAPATTPTTDVVESTSAYPDDLPEELGAVVVGGINAFIQDKDIMQYISGGSEISSYVTSNSVVEAMKQDEKFRPLVISDQLELVGYEKQAKDEYLFTFKSEMGSNVSLSYLRVGDDEWKMDISDLLTSGTFRVPTGVSVKINGDDVPSSQYSSGSEIKINGLLKNVPITVTYETGLYKDYSGSFILTGSSGTQDARYILGQDDTDIILPQVESLWRSLQSMVVSGTADNHWGLFYPETRVTASMIMFGWEASATTPPEELVLQGMALNRSDGVVSAYLESKDVISLNLQSTFLKVQGVADTKTVTNWIKVVKEDNQIKLYDCSAEVWLGSGL